MPFSSSRDAVDWVRQRMTQAHEDELWNGWEGRVIVVVYPSKVGLEPKTADIPLRTLQFTV